MDVEKTLEELYAANAGALRLVHVRVVKGRSLPVRSVVLIAGGAALATVLAIAITVAGIDTPRAGTPSSQNFSVTSSPPPGSALTRSQAIGRALGDRAAIRRADRAEAKLVRTGDLAKGISGAAEMGADPTRFVWAVAVAGDIRVVSLRDVPERWGIWVVDAATGDILAMVANDDADWPSAFDELIDQAPVGG